jgi:hypothetical protein
VGGTTQVEAFVNLGREDRLDLEALRRLARSINRYLGEELGADGAAGMDRSTTAPSRRTTTGMPATGPESPPGEPSRR